MNPVVEKTADKAAIQSLVDRCVSLCSNAESAIQDLSEERQPFLARSLEDTLQQLEVVLKTLDSLDGDDEGFTSTKAPQGFIRRLIARTEAHGRSGEAGPVRPKFDVSRQGLHGNTWTVSLAEILGFLAFGTKTGVLWVDGPDENFLLGLVEGRLRHVTSDQTPEGLRLGEVLVGYGFLTRSQLERFLSRQKADDGDLAGEILLDTGIISQEELDTALAYQVRQNFSRLLNTRNAIFRFREGLTVNLVHQMDMDINQLILENAQADDEASRDAGGTAGVQEDWHSWTSELSAQVAGVILEESDSAEKRDEKKAKATTKAKPKDPNDAKAATKEENPTDPEPPSTAATPSDAAVEEKKKKTKPDPVEKAEETSGT